MSIQNHTIQNHTIQNHTGFLPMEKYTEACSLTQIISFDLLIKNKEGKYLLGLRKNPPARNTYFVPGSRVLKKETLSSALSRIMKDELGCVLNNLKHKGVYEHYYENDNPTGVENVDTHYVVFVFEGEIPHDFNQEQFHKQHSSAKWMSTHEILESDHVHRFSKYYFMENPSNYFNTSFI